MSFAIKRIVISMLLFACVAALVACSNSGENAKHLSVKLKSPSTTVAPTTTVAPPTTTAPVPVTEPAPAVQAPAPTIQPSQPQAQGSGACGGATNGADQYIGRETNGSSDPVNQDSLEGSGAHGCYQILPSTWASSCSDLGPLNGSSAGAQAQCASRLPLSAWGG